MLSEVFFVRLSVAYAEGEILSNAMLRVVFLVMLNALHH